MKTYYSNYNLLLGLLFLPIFLAANEPPETIYQVLTQGDKIPQIEIVTDLERLINDRNSTDYIEAKLNVKNDVIETSYDLKVQARGKFRRKICQFPPVRLNFSKGYLKSIGLKKHDKLKLVTHCMEDKLSGNDNVSKEYLAYQMYAALTPNSFKARLVKVTYIDSKGNLSKVKRYGILIEDTDEMAERLGGEECEDCFNTPSDQILPKEESLMALFQYMIGNEDWSIPNSRNVKLVNLENGQKIPVPYDFDFSGMVNASYAIPRYEEFGLKSIEERYFLGYTQNQELLVEAFELLAKHKDQLIKIVRQQKEVSIMERERVENYIHSFFDQKEDFFKHLELVKSRELERNPNLINGPEKK